jgi:glucose-specific phosphotransferase system IIA component
MNEKVSAERLEIFAPLSGFLTPIETIPDPVFAQKLVGDGVSLDPTSECLKAPVAGEIIQLHASSHALTIKTASGVEVLVHIGLDTVKLGGRGFEALVKKGDLVEKGQELIRFNADLVATSARSLLTQIVISNPESVSEIIKETGTVEAGSDVIFSVIPVNVPELPQFEPFAEPVAEPFPVQIEDAPHRLDRFAGIAVSKGISTGRLLKVRSEKFDCNDRGKGGKFEQAEFNNAVRRAVLQLSSISDKLKRAGNLESAAIFATQAELLENHELLEMVERAIIAGKSAPSAWRKAFNAHADKLLALNDQVLAVKAHNLRDVGARVMRILLSIEEKPLKISENQVIVADDLMPSTFAGLDMALIAGICTTSAGDASYVGIFADAMPFPVIIGLTPKVFDLADGINVRVDGDNALLTVVSATDSKVGE